jgi:hypothetical protein
MTLGTASFLSFWGSGLFNIFVGFFHLSSFF